MFTMAWNSCDLKSKPMSVWHPVGDVALFGNIATMRGNLNARGAISDSARAIRGSVS